MSENVIFIINFFLYNIQSIACPIYEGMALKPRHSAIRIVIIYMAMFGYPAIIKYDMPLYDSSQMASSGVINLLYVIYLMICYDEKPSRCIFVHAMFLAVSVLISMLWNFMPDPLSSNSDIQTTIGYLITIPVTYSLLYLLARVLIKIQKKNMHFDYSVALLAFGFSLQTLFTSVMALMSGVYLSDSMKHLVPLIIMLSSILITVCAVFALAYRKNSELELKSRLMQLETARSLEEESYRQTLERIDAMAKLRHDFYGQLQAARYLLEASPDEGKRMLEDMRRQLDTYE